MALINITEQLAQLVLWLDIHSKPVLCQLQYYINYLKMFLHQIKIDIDSILPWFGNYEYLCKHIIEIDR